MAKSAMSPLTVFMPAYNAAAHLAEAVESVLGQSLGDFEFLIIDDGSTDATPHLLRRYARADRRIRLLAHKRNRGLAATFAHGYREARTRFVARMDADDVCEKRRLELQMRRLRAATDVAVLGAWIRTFGQAEKVVRLPWLHEDILCAAPFFNPMAHPTVLLDRERLPEPPAFRAAYQPSDDYDLWSRWLRKGVRFAALPEPLLRYRLHPGQSGHQPQMVTGARRVRADWRRWLGLGPGAIPAAAWQKAGRARGLPERPWRWRVGLSAEQAGSRLANLDWDLHRSWAYALHRLHIA